MHLLISLRFLHFDSFLWTNHGIDEPDTNDAILFTRSPLHDLSTEIFQNVPYLLYIDKFNYLNKKMEDS